MERLYRLLMGLCVALLAGIAVLSFVQIVCRYALTLSLPWSNELVQFMMMWLVLLGTGALLWRGSHFALDYLVIRLPPRLARLVTFVNHVLIVGFGVFLGVTGWNLAMAQKTQMVPALDVSYATVYLAMPLGAAFIIVFAAAVAARSLRKDPHPDASKEVGS